MMVRVDEGGYNVAVLSCTDGVMLSVNARAKTASDGGQRFVTRPR